MTETTPDPESIRRMAHQLRNLLAPAMMMAERIAEHSDPDVRRAAAVILASLDRATAAIRGQTPPKA